MKIEEIFSCLILVSVRYFKRSVLFINERFVLFVNELKINVSVCSLTFRLFSNNGTLPSPIVNTLTSGTLRPFTP